MVNTALVHLILLNSASFQLTPCFVHFRVFSPLPFIRQWHFCPVFAINHSIINETLMVTKKIWPALLAFLFPLVLFAQSKHNFSVSGTIKDIKTGETLTGATIGFLEHSGLGVVTNAYGFYSITIPEGKYSMIISFSGYAPAT